MIAFAQLVDLELSDSQPVIYDRPIGLRLLHRDHASGAEHYLIRYPTGLVAQAHTHTAAHTILVLDGLLLVNDQPIGVGGYCHFDSGEPMRHQPAPGQHCLFVIIFDGPFDVIPIEA